MLGRLRSRLRGVLPLSLDLSQVGLEGRASVARLGRHEAKPVRSLPHPSDRFRHTEDQRRKLSAGPGRAELSRHWRASSTRAVRRSCAYGMQCLGLDEFTASFERKVRLDQRGPTSSCGAIDGGCLCTSARPTMSSLASAALFCPTWRSSPSLKARLIMQRSCRWVPSLTATAAEGHLQTIRGDEP